MKTARVKGGVTIWLDDDTDADVITMIYEQMACSGATLDGYMRRVLSHALWNLQDEMRARKRALGMKPLTVDELRNLTATEG